MKLETVFVVLGIPKPGDGPMPATITRLGREKAPQYRYLSPEQLEAMAGDQTAYWKAERVDGQFWLVERLPNKVTDEAVRAWQRTPVKFDDAEIPF